MVSVSVQQTAFIFEAVIHTTTCTELCDLVASSAVAAASSEHESEIPEATAIRSPCVVSRYFVSLSSCNTSGYCVVTPSDYTDHCMDESVTVLPASHHGQWALNVILTFRNG